MNSWARAKAQIEWFVPEYGSACLLLHFLVNQCVNGESTRRAITYAEMEHGIIIDDEVKAPGVGFCRATLDKWMKLWEETGIVVVHKVTRGMLSFNEVEIDLDELDHQSERARKKMGRTTRIKPKNSHVQKIDTGCLENRHAVSKNQTPLNSSLNSNLLTGGDSVAIVRKEVEDKKRTRKKAKERTAGGSRIAISEAWADVLSKHEVQSTSPLGQRELGKIATQHRNLGAKENVYDVMYWVVEHWGEMPKLMGQHWDRPVSGVFVAQQWKHIVDAYRAKGDLGYAYKDSKLTHIEEQNAKLRKMLVDQSNEITGLRENQRRPSTKEKKGW